MKRVTTLFTFRIMFKDAHTINYGRFQFKRTNITAVRLIDPTSAIVNATIHDLNFVIQRMKMNVDVFQAETMTVMKIILYFKRIKKKERICLVH